MILDTFMALIFSTYALLCINMNPISFLFNNNPFPSFICLLINLYNIQELKKVGLRKKLRGRKMKYKIERHKYIKYNSGRKQAVYKNFQ